MTTAQVFRSLVAESSYTVACDAWFSILSHRATGDLHEANRFRDLRERLGDQTAAETVADAMAAA